MSNAKKPTPDHGNAEAIEFLVSPKRKTRTATGDAQENVVEVNSRSATAVEGAELPSKMKSEQPSATKRVGGNPAKRREPKSTSRSQLPKRDFSQRVRSDIHERLDDEHYRRKKNGDPMKKGEIADEALHLGLLQIEKRRPRDLG